ITARPHAAQLLNRAGQRDAIQRIDTRHGSPETVLALSAQTPFEIEAPGLRVLIPELQRLERNADLRKPAVAGDPRAHIPHAVPVRIHLPAFVGHLGVPLRAGRVYRKLETVTLIGERVDDDEEAVARCGIEAFFQLTADDAGRFEFAI